MHCTAPYCFRSPVTTGPSDAEGECPTCLSTKTLRPFWRVSLTFSRERIEGEYPIALKAARFEADWLSCACCLSWTPSIAVHEACAAVRRDSPTADLLQLFRERPAVEPSWERWRSAAGDGNPTLRVLGLVSRNQVSRCETCRLPSTCLIMLHLMMPHAGRRGVAAGRPVPVRPYSAHPQHGSHGEPEGRAAGPDGAEVHLVQESQRLRPRRAAGVFLRTTGSSM